MYVNRERYERIPSMLRELKYLNKCYTDHSEFTDYTVPVMKIAAVCEYMLGIMLEENGMEIVDGQVVDAEHSYVGNRCPILEYCSTQQLECVPSEIRKMVEIMNIHQMCAAQRKPISNRRGVVKQ